MAMMFLNPPPSPHAIVTHVDRNLANNSIANLAWASKNSTTTTIPNRPASRRRGLLKPVTEYRKVYDSHDHCTRSVPYCMWFSVTDLVEGLKLPASACATIIQILKQGGGRLAYGMRLEYESYLVEDYEIYTTLELPGYEAVSVSNFGRLKMRDGRFGYGKTSKKHKGHRVCSLESLTGNKMDRLTVTVDMLVLQAFYRIGNLSPTCYVMHINGNKRDNNLFNLAIIKASSDDARDMGTISATFRPLACAAVCHAIFREHSRGNRHYYAPVLLPHYSTGINSLPESEVELKQCIAQVRSPSPAL